MIPNRVCVIIDRPIGYIDKYSNIYPVNYGFIPGVIGGDGEEQDAYVLDAERPLATYAGKVIAVIHRKNDVETKWVVSNKPLGEAEIAKKIEFMEKYFDSYIEML